MEHLENLIGGARVPALTDSADPLVDPATGRQIGTAPRSCADDVDAAYAAACEGFEVWRRATPAERSRSLLAVADDVESRAKELIDAECLLTGKPRAQVARDELPGVIDTIRFFAGVARTSNGSAAGHFAAGHESWTRREPVGVVAAITPWDYPLWMATLKWAPAVAAGNSVVLKPAATTPVTPLLLAEIAAAHLPDGVLNVVCGDASTGQALVEHPVPSLVALTGSVEAGRDVAARAGALLKRTHLELGGKAAVLVCDDADIEAAAEGIVAAGMYNSGQSCTAATRLILDEAIADELVAIIAERANRLTVGGPDEDADLGPLNSAAHLEHVDRLVASALTDGADPIIGGERVQREGFFYPPTLLGGVRHGTETAEREVFGPVMTVETYADLDDGVRWANATPYGLAASVWTASHRRALDLVDRLDAGTVWVNCHSVMAAEVPNGGVKDSGWGSDLSRWSLEAYTTTKAVTSRR